MDTRRPGRPAVVGPALAAIRDTPEHGAATVRLQAGSYGGTMGVLDVFLVGAALVAIRDTQEHGAATIRLQAGSYAGPMGVL